MDRGWVQRFVWRDGGAVVERWTDGGGWVLYALIGEDDGVRARAAVFDIAVLPIKYCCLLMLGWKMTQLPLPCHGLLAGEKS